MTTTPIKIQFIKSLSNLKPSRIMCVKADGDDDFSLYITDKDGLPYPIKDSSVSIQNTDGNLDISGTTTVTVNIAQTLLDTINSALQSGDNISELVNDAGYITSFTETDPIFQASEASLFVSGDKDNLDNQSGVNSGDETTSSIQTKRPIKTINGDSLEGTGNITIDYNDLDNIPTTFTPSAHTHTESEITDLDKYTQSEVDTLLENKVDLNIINDDNIPRLYVGNTRKEWTKGLPSFTGILAIEITGLYNQSSMNGVMNVHLLEVGSEKHSRCIGISGQWDKDLSAWDYGFGADPCNPEPLTIRFAKDLVNEKVYVLLGDLTTLYPNVRVSIEIPLSSYNPSLNLGFNIASLSSLTGITTDIQSIVEPKLKDLYQKWVATKYEKQTTVIQNNKLYILSDTTTLPFNSTDFATELVSGSWVEVIPDASETVDGKVSTGTQGFSGNKSIKGESTTLGNALTIKDSANTEIARFQNNGNVGIGTVSPSVKLEVAGTAKANEFIIGTASSGDVNTRFGFEALLNQTTNNQYSTAFGNRALKSQTTGAGNVAIGKSALITNTIGNSNTAIGTDALFFNLTGSSNTAVGNSSLKANTGSNNVAVGVSALISNTSGSRNTAIGYDALAGLSGANNNNTAIGAGAGKYCYTGYENVFIGDSSGQGIKSGYRNVIMGMYAVDYNYNTGAGQLNTIIGYKAGRSLTEAVQNVILGAHAMESVNYTSYYNIVIGYQAGKDLTSGNSNVIIGTNAGTGNSTGCANNILIGTNAGVYTTIPSYNTYIGENSGYYSKGDNNVALGKDAGNKGSALQAVQSDRNTFIGNYSGQNTAGSGNVFIGYYSGHGLGTINNELHIHNVISPNPLIWGNFSLGHLKFNINNLNLSNIPTTSVGLVAGDIWNDAGILKII